jgi:hypothetical protein
MRFCLAFCTLLCVNKQALSEGALGYAAYMFSE